MSAKIMGKAWELNLPANKLLVLLAMADHADHNGDNVFPGMALIAYKTGYSERQVKRIVAALVKDGILVEHKGRSKLGTKLYSIRLDAGESKPPYQPDKRSDNMSHSHSDKMAQPQGDKMSLHEEPDEVTKSPERSDILSINGSDILSSNPRTIEPSLEPSVKDSAQTPAKIKQGKAFAIKEALVKAMGYDPQDITASLQRSLFKVAHQLIECANPVLPDEVASLVAYAKLGTKGNFSIFWISGKVADWRKVQREGKTPPASSAAPPPNGKSRQELDIERIKADQERQRAIWAQQKKASGQ